MWGYRAGDRDLQELERQTARYRQRERGAPDERADMRGDRRDGAGRTQMRVVEAVVRDRVQDPDSQRRILDAARTRIADWLERGARFEPQAEPRRSAPERQRGR
jgi:hypothetical protein